MVKHDYSKAPGTNHFISIIQTLSYSADVFTWSQKKGHLSSRLKHTYSEVPEVSNFDS